MGQTISFIFSQPPTIQCCLGGFFRAWWKEGEGGKSIWKKSELYFDRDYRDFKTLRLHVWSFTVNFTAMLY